VERFQAHQAEHQGRAARSWRQDGRLPRGPHPGTRNVAGLRPLKARQTPLPTRQQDGGARIRLAAD